MGIINDINLILFIRDEFLQYSITSRELGEVYTVNLKDNYNYNFYSSGISPTGKFEMHIFILERILDNFFEIGCSCFIALKKFDNEFWIPKRF